MKHYQQRHYAGTLKKLTPRDRFEAKVNRNGPIPECRPDLGRCWIWTGAIRSTGYGFMQVDRRTIGVYRYAYETFIGPIPPDFEPDHLCRVRACCNPAHLEAVTHRENTLRGDGPTAMNAVKTHCPQLHEYSEANTNSYTRPGHRYCKPCIRERTRTRRDEERHGLRAPGMCPTCKTSRRVPGRSYCGPCAVAVTRRSEAKRNVHFL